MPYDVLHSPNNNEMKISLGVITLSVIGATHIANDQIGQEAQKAAIQKVAE